MSYDEFRDWIAYANVYGLPAFRNDYYGQQMAYVTAQVNSKKDLNSADFRAVFEAPKPRPFSELVTMMRGYAASHNARLVKPT